MVDFVEGAVPARREVQGGGGEGGGGAQELRVHAAVDDVEVHVVYLCMVV
jgi:hypothetical protein